ncbi:MAG: RluA family pseudouridine synthase [Eubacteriales bacterium]
MEIKIEPRYDGTTVREFVKNELGLSRSLLTRLKNIDGGIIKNGIEVTVRSLLHPGDILTLKLEDSISDVNEFIIPCCLPLDIIYEDNDIIAVNKPSAMPTHPSFGHPGDSLANALTYYFETQNFPFVFRAVNRLDCDTSGIVLVAKNQLSAYKLSRQMICGDIKKTYIAVASGTLPTDGDEIITYIRRKNNSIILREVCTASDEGGAFAHTVYKTLAVTGEYSIADVITQTGRTHQIRVHFAHIGYPLVGDYLYGIKNEQGMTHHALHARLLIFTHPSNGERIILRALPPPDIRALINNITNYGDLYND